MITLESLANFVGFQFTPRKLKHSPFFAICAAARGADRIRDVNDAVYSAMCEYEWRTGERPTKLFVTRDVWFELLDAMPSLAFQFPHWGTPGEPRQPEFNGMRVYIIHSDDHEFHVAS